MRHALPALSILIAAIACLPLAVACGDDDDGGEPSLASYFSDLEAIFVDFEQTSGEVEADHPGVFDDLEDTESYYAELLEVMRPAFANIAALEPPPEIAPEHQALIEATQDFFDELARVSDEVESIEDEADLAEYADDLNTDPGLTRSRAAVGDACNDLQDIADDNQIEVDLLCGEASNPVDDAVLASYFSAVEGIFERADDDTSAAQEALDAALQDATFDQQKAAIETYLTSIESTFTDTINRLRGLAPPDPVQDAQNDFVGAIEHMVASSSSFKANLATIADAEHLDTRRADFGEQISAAVERADAACSDLQRIAEGRDIDVDLGCEG